MKYLFQFMIIALLAFLGELCYYFIPFKIPASVYGLLILMFCLFTKIIKLKQIEEVATFLLAIMPVLFIPPAVALIEIMFNIKSELLKIGIIVMVSTIAVIISTGLTSEFIIKYQTRKKKKKAK